MGFGSIIGLGKKTDKAFEELQTDMAHALEEGMDDIFEQSFTDGFEASEDFALDDETGERRVVSSASIDPDDADIIEGTAQDERLTAHTRNRLEALKGDRVGQYSIRVNDQWRICFTWTEGGAEDVELVDYH